MWQSFRRQETAWRATMPEPTPSHSADDSAIGYYHQGGYALVVLLDASDSASVSIETDDDVVVHDSVTSLRQLKHSLGKPPAVTVKNDGLWNTIGFWSDGPFDGSLEFVFVTCASISGASELEALKVTGSDRSALLSAMESEALRVAEERKVARDAKADRLPYAERYKACARFMALGARDRRRLVDLMRLTPDSFTAANIADEVSNRLRYSIRHEVRQQIVERLIEWWDRQVALSLMRKRERRISKAELHNRLSDLTIEYSSIGLPNRFQDARPESVTSVTGTVMEQQILWVKGGKHRVDRAAVARWRARNQRDEWLSGDFAAASELELFDQRLLEAWGDKFHPMKEDCDGSAAENCCKEGCKLLDWSHFEAHNAVLPVRPQAPHSYIVQGSLQQFAEEGLVGWHPGFREMLEALKAGKAT